MDTDQSGTHNQPQERHEESSQEGGPISGMLKGTVSNLGENLRSIVRGEVSLAKRELKQEASQLGRAGGMIAGSGVLGLNGFMFLMWGLIFLIARKLPLWASASIVGSALVTIAGILGTTGKNRLQQTDLTPEETIASLKEDKDAAGEAVSSAKDDLTPGSAQRSSRAIPAGDCTLPDYEAKPKDSHLLQEPSESVAVLGPVLSAREGNHHMNQHQSDAAGTDEARDEESHTGNKARKAENPAPEKSEEAEREQERQLESGEENPV